MKKSEPMHLAIYQRDLRGEFERRQTRNSSYSLRSFARDIGISAPTLSEVMNGQRHFRMRTASKAAERLRWSRSKVEAMMDEIRDASAVKNDKRRFAEEQAKLFNESFDQVAEWYLMAIAHLSQIPNTSADPQSLADRLGISVAQAEAALLVLTEGEFVRNEGGRLVPGRMASGPYIITRVNEKVIRYQEDLLRKASEAIRECAPAKRLSLMRMMPLLPEELHRFEAMFWRFYQSVQKRAKQLEAKELYCLSVQFFPLTRLDKKPR